MKTRPPIKLGIIVSRFNEKVTERLLNGAQDRCRDLNIDEDQVDVVRVPGAVEIPLTAQQMVMSGKYDAVICLGAVIRGETDHYDYVCQQVSDGCQRVALKYNVPIIFGVLTTHNEALALARAGGEQGNKGRDSIDAALSMIEVIRSFQPAVQIREISHA